MGKRKAAGVIRQVRLGPLDTQGTFKRNAPVQKQRRARLLDEHASSHRTTFLISILSSTSPGLNAQVCSPVIDDRSDNTIKIKNPLRQIFFPLLVNFRNHILSLVIIILMSGLCGGNPDIDFDCQYSYKLIV